VQINGDMKGDHKETAVPKETRRVNVDDEGGTEIREVVAQPATLCLKTGFMN
jgi:hypothetical protein